MPGTVLGVGIHHWATPYIAGLTHFTLTNLLESLINPISYMTAGYRAAQ